MRVVNVSSNGFALVSQSLYLIFKYDNSKSISVYLDYDLHLDLLIYHI